MISPFNSGNEVFQIPNFILPFLFGGFFFIQPLHFPNDGRLLEMVGVDTATLADVGFNEAAENSVSNRKTFLYRPYAAGALLSLLMWF